MNGNYEKSIKVLGVPKLCPNIKDPNLTCVIQNHKFAKVP